MIRMLHVEPNTVMRLMLKEVLNVPELDIVASVSHLAELEAQPPAGAVPDLLMVAIDEANNSFERIRDWCNRNPSVKVIAVLTDCTPERLLTAAQTGVEGLVLTDQAPAEIARTVVMVAMGERVYAQEATEILSRYAPEVEEAGDPGEALTPSERLILGYLHAGCSNRHIAGFLHREEREVKALVHALFRKLKLRNRTQAALWAARHPHRIVTPEHFEGVAKRPWSR